MDEDTPRFRFLLLCGGLQVGAQLSWLHPVVSKFKLWICIPSPSPSPTPTPPRVSAEVSTSFYLSSRSLGVGSIALATLKASSFCVNPVCKHCTVCAASQCNRVLCRRGSTTLALLFFLTIPHSASGIRSSAFLRSISLRACFAEAACPRSKVQVRV